MDLLDLQLDLDVEGNSSDGPVTRRSQASRAAKTTTPAAATPKAPSKSTSVAKTPATVKNTTTKTPGPSTASSAIKKPVATPKISTTTNSTDSKIAKTAPTPKAAANIASASKTAPPVQAASPSKVAKSVAETPAVPSKAAVTPKVAQLRDDLSASPSESRGSSADRTSRSESMEKRSRNKAKKRFSPSPDVPSKKRRSTCPARPTSSSSAAAASSSSVIAPVELTVAMFAENVALLNNILKQQGPTDYELPAHWDAEDEETASDYEIDAPGLPIRNAEAPSQKASSSSPPSKNNRTESLKSPKPSVPISSDSKGKAANPSMEPIGESAARKVGGADQAETSSKKKSRGRSQSRDLAVGGNSADVEDARKARRTSTSSPKRSKKQDAQLPGSSIKAPRRSMRQSTAGQEDIEQKEIKKEEEEEEEAPKSQLRVSKRRNSSAKQPADEIDAATPKKVIKKKAAECEAEESDKDQPTSSTTPETPKKISKPNPNSALAIRQKLMESQDPRSARKLKKSVPSVARKPSVIDLEKKPKEEILDAEDTQQPIASTPKPSLVEPKPEPVKEAASEKPTSSKTLATPSKAKPVLPKTAVPAAESKVVSPIKFKTPVTSAPTARPTRTSGRVSKPNRLYIDSDFNTEVIGRDRVTEQNIVNEIQAKEATPEAPVPTTPILASTSSQPPKKKSTPKEYVPKPIPILNGVQRGYIASVKVPLEDIEVDGVVEKLNEVVTSVMDVVLFKVCGDGVERHENIDPKVVRAKAKIKSDLTKRARFEAKKLDIQMSMKMPSSSEDLGKRKRQAPRADDYYWNPPVHKSKLQKEIREEQDNTPEPEEAPPAEKVQQKARESISHMFDAEMDATMKEADKYSISFDKYITPKVATAKKRAGIQLVSQKRKSAVVDDFFYHELLTDKHSPTTSNVENEDVDVDVDGIEEEPDAPVTHEGVISIRTDALDIAEQMVVLIPRPTQADGSPITAEDLEEALIEQTESRKITFKNTMQIILDQLSHESAPGNVDIDELGCNWFTVTSANSQRLKNVYNRCEPEREDVAIGTHHFLIENLPVHILASYLSLLRYARRLEPSRFGFIINSTDDLDDDWREATTIMKSFVYKRNAEPGTEVLHRTIPYNRLPDTVFLLVSPTMTFGGVNSQARLHGRLFRWLKSIGHPDSELIGFNEDFDQSCTVAEYLTDTIIDAICDKVRQKNRERPHCKIVLVGYGAATYLVHRAVNLVEGVSCIISIGFPVMTKFGRRGSPDDEILLTYCPTLFIVGADGRRFDNRAITELRNSMVAPTGLVIVAHANDQLLVPSTYLLRMGISQTVVFRIVLEKILDFLMLDGIRDQEATDLTPIELHNIYQLDSVLLKSEKALSGLAFSSSTPTPSPSPVGSSGRRATVAGGEEMPKKRKQEPSTSQQQLYTPHGSIPAPSPRAEDRFLAFQNLVTSTVATMDDMPRRASMGSTPRVVERGDFRDRAAALAAASSSRAPSTSSAPVARGPIDPASISLT